jgi:hypothetical protein
VPPVPAGFQAGDQAFRVSLQVALADQPLVTVQTPLRLVVRVDATDLALTGGDLTRLYLARVSALGVWQAVSCAADVSTGSLTCDTSGTGVFSVMIVPPAVGPVDFDLTNGHFYQQGNGFGGGGALGYAVTDDDAAPMWSEFQRLGGVGVLGYPITSRFLYRGLPTQVFQKLVLQWQPQFSSAVPLTLFDELSPRGSDGWPSDTQQIPPPQDASADIPWAPAGTVVLGNAGDISKTAGLWQDDATAPAAPPPAVTSEPTVGSD